MTIVFRSTVLDHRHTGNSRKNIRHSGTDWASLRLYDNDDTRDIVWSRSTNEKIYVKERENTGSIEISSVFISGIGDDFYIDSVSNSKGYYMKKAEKIIRKSVIENNYRYTMYNSSDITGIGDRLHMQNTKGNLILIFRSFIGAGYTPECIEKLGYMNDVIIIDILHPFDISPTSNIMLSGKILNNTGIFQYQNAFKKEKNEEEKTLRNHHISYIQISTHENLETRLNYFFKKRYNHG